MNSVGYIYPLGHAYFSQVATRTVSFGLKEAEQCIMSMVGIFLEL